MRSQQHMQQLSLLSLLSIPIPIGASVRQDKIGTRVAEKACSCCPLACLACPRPPGIVPPKYRDSLDTVPPIGLVVPRHLALVHAPIVKPLHREAASGTLGTHPAPRKDTLALRPNSAACSPCGAGVLCCAALQSTPAPTLETVPPTRHPADQRSAGTSATGSGANSPLGSRAR